MPYRQIIGQIISDGAAWLPGLQIEYSGVAERDQHGHVKTYTVAIETLGKHTACLVDAGTGDIRPMPGTSLGRFVTLAEAVSWCQVYEMAVGWVREYDQHLTALADRREADKPLEAERQNVDTDWRAWAKEMKWHGGVAI